MQAVELVFILSQTVAELFCLKFSIASPAPVATVWMG